ncbi:uncharacterized protein TM35_000501430 [Trypanosoma theileri]|uniref:Mucin TcMUCII n=1 Tax=Trypanosoma theileri TaxID=67003 RepID=A0A1X0NIS9_9TRYP|nr:uncharacterized protein TM35_000501430 [Trypanosoma theileri]ORC84089.1 hypothetical protein TM35_000501430 [Trypanosoma theileri]
MMAIRHLFCVLTIALCCLCSCVVAAEEAEANALEAKSTELGPDGLPVPGIGKSKTSSCPSTSPPGADTSQCLKSSGEEDNNDHVNRDHSQELVQPHSPVIHTNGDHREEGTVSSGTKNELTEAGQKAVENNPHVGVVPERAARDITANPDSARGEPGVTAVDVETTSPTRETPPRTTEHIDPKIDG